MKILGLIQQERMASIEDRRKILQRKNVGDVYRKNLQYVQPKINPVLVELEKLLLGHKELDLYEKHKEESKEMTPQEQATIREMQQAKKNVCVHEHNHKAVDGENNSGISHVQESDNARNVVKSEIPIVASGRLNDKETLESVSRAALAPADPSPAANTAGEIAYLNEESIEVEIPARFSKELKLDPFADTIFGRSYEELYRASVFKRASATYTAHSEMAKNGYRPGNEPTFSMTA